MVNTEALSAAIADLRSQKKPNFFATAKKHRIDRTTLRRRFQGKQTPRGVSHIETQGHLSVKMEEVFIERINIFSARGFPSMFQFIANMVLEFFGEQVCPNWVSCFVKRHDDDFSSNVASRPMGHFFNYRQLQTLSTSRNYYTVTDHK